MGTTLQHSYVHSAEVAKKSLWERFIVWCDSQEQYRFGWAGATITLHGCFLTIGTMFAIILSGNHFIFWPFAIAAMGAPLVANLAAMPTRVILPVFFLSIVVDLIIIACCIAIGFDISGTKI
jgi:hypothetical protein